MESQMLKVLGLPQNANKQQIADAIQSKIDPDKLSVEEVKALIEIVKMLYKNSEQQNMQQQDTQQQDMHQQDIQQREIIKMLQEQNRIEQTNQLDQEPELVKQQINKQQIEDLERRVGEVFGDGQEEEQPQQYATEEMPILAMPTVLPKMSSIEDMMGNIAREYQKQRNDYESNKEEKGSLLNRIVEAVFGNTEHTDLISDVLYHIYNMVFGPDTNPNDIEEKLDSDGVTFYKAISTIYDGKGTPKVKGFIIRKNGDHVSKEIIGENPYSGDQTALSPRSMAFVGGGNSKVRKFKINYK